MIPIVVTGMGVISAIGNNLIVFSENLLTGIGGISEITCFDTTSFRCQIAAEVKNYDSSLHFDARKLSLLDRFSQFAVISAREAVKDANLTINPDNAHRIAIIHGTGIGGENTHDEQYYRLYSEKQTKLHPFTVPKIMPSASVANISMDLGITGVTLGTTSACASSGQAIAMGMILLQSGYADVAVVGGAEAPITPGCVRAWESLKILAKDTCRPFSIKRGGLVLAEGAGSLVLETLSHAKQRQAFIQAVLTGFGMSADASDLLQPNVKGVCASMQNALNHAQLQPQEIDYINAHGTGTGQNDQVETQGIHAVFGNHASKLAVSSSKSMFGHGLGAAGALEAIATIIALKNNIAPPTMNYLGLDTNCDLDYVPNIPKAMKINHAMSNSFAFGGLNVSLIFSKFKP